MDRGSCVRAIGWLSRDHPFPIGPTHWLFLHELQAHLEHPWAPIAAMGGHRCEFCDPSDPRPGHYNHANLWVPNGSLVYVAPAMTLHYIMHHGYCPPQEFIDAVLFCPQQRSLAYFELFRDLSPGAVSDGTFKFARQEMSPRRR